MWLVLRLKSLVDGALVYLSKMQLAEKIRNRFIKAIHRINYMNEEKMPSMISQYRHTGYICLLLDTQHLQTVAG